VDAGFAGLTAVTQALREGLAARGVRVAENTEPLAITWADGTWTVATSGGPVESDALVVTAGLGTNDVLSLVPQELQRQAQETRAACPHQPEHRQPAHTSPLTSQFRLERSH
jgi:glycine/D-amino acid oxidase-like deaminating enzyme